MHEYLLEKFHRQCAYCESKDVPLEIEHIVPKSRGGTNRVSNLTLACHSCNQTKGNQTAIEFGHPNVQKLAKQPLKDVAAVNTTRWVLFRRLETTGLRLEVGTGGRTKFNRTRQSYPKIHWIDAACVGESGACVFLNPNQDYLHIKAIGHGSRQMCGNDKFGFPTRHRARNKFSFGFQTGDIVQAIVPKGQYKGTYVGRIIIRNRPSFRLNRFDLHPKYLTLIHYAEGYSYAKQ